MQNQQDHKALILQAINSVPSGRVASYATIAKMSGLPRHARYVAAVLKKLPQDSTLPWHRIIKSDGHIAFAKDSPQFQRQQALLQSEHIPCDSGRVNMKNYAI